eukprot:CAMPEP_0182942248 /NCGR_PEP_ID=MMETSP0105_2-20130417/50327_1 /TAXON_ID=81532 ORGANISM="Acanthoeca-like sp., Strain 10tr" /NCGR_SAMPLE_ID=MMETSP0105_2 /ASSEMBLY_ACC=CAM_ASM_000205 /LENGTH=243 /DNA_ID=CAMNT_0025081955 /DNA_START=17 /DNA_END=748 /DNA_ORIENTATION=-
MMVPVSGAAGADGAAGPADVGGATYGGVARRSIRACVEKLRPALRAPPAVLIDTASVYLLSHSASVLARELRGMLDDGVAASIAIVLHRDLTSGPTLASLRAVAPAVVELSVGGPGGFTPVVSRLELIKPSGKVVVERAGLTFGELCGDKSGVSVVPSGGGGGLRGPAEPAEAAAAAAGADTARASQSAGGVRDIDRKATLPFHLTEAEQQGALAGGAGGRILYEPDDADDFDDEDPDDDLDI